MCSIGRTRRGKRDITARENLFVLRGEGIDVKKIICNRATHRKRWSTQPPIMTHHYVNLMVDTDQIYTFTCDGCHLLTMPRSSIYVSVLISMSLSGSTWSPGVHGVNSPFKATQVMPSPLLSAERAERERERDRRNRPTERPRTRERATSRLAL